MRFLDELEQRIAADEIEMTRQAAWREAEEMLEQALRKLERSQPDWEE